MHSDICGPLNPVSNGNKKYFVSFIDDFSRKVWVYFLQEKSEAFSAFKSFKALVENESGRRIKILRTDRGGEYCSKEFETYCDVQGIHRQLTTAYTPQQNGVSERKNRTILNMVRSLLFTGRVPKSFWLEAVLWSTHVLNRCPTFAVQNMTPEEAWSGRKPSVDHFKVFGCIAYAHIPDEKMTKLDEKGEKCVFLGISEHSKAYKLFNPVTKRVITSRDVIFDEEMTWDWTAKGNAPQQLPVDLDATEGTELEQHPFNESLPYSSQMTQINEQPTVNQRLRKQPAWMMDYVSGDELSEDDSLAHYALFADCDPVRFEDAAQDPKWQKAMDEEIAAIKKNQTWELTDLPMGHKAIGVKWVYKTKLNKEGKVDKYKARLIVKGYKQEYGVDYQEVFAPVARHDTIRLVLALASQNSWQVFQMDVKSAFLHDDLVEEVYVDQAPGYVIQGKEKKVYRLRKALYGLKQAPRAWYSRIATYFTSATLFADFKQSMMAEFDMSDLGLMHYFLGIEVVQSDKGIFITQRKYALEILDRFQMKNCNPVRTPTEPGLKLSKDLKGKKVNSSFFKQIVGSLLYLTATRPDIMHAVSIISRYMEYPTENHLHAAKRILRYVKGTADFGIFYMKGACSDFFGFCDSDYAGDVDDRRSTSGYTFMMSLGVVSFSSKKQEIVTLPTTEAEFVAATACVCQAIWLKRILLVLHKEQYGPIRIYCDNSLTIKLSKNPVLHGRSKHIDVRYYFLRDLAQDGTIELVYCRSEERIADLFTKPLKLASFEKLRNLLGIRSVCSLN